MAYVCLLLVNNMSDLDRFELFALTLLKIVGNITQTADKLQLTKAAVSKQIKKLEIYFRDNLFSRTGQRLRLTEQGKALLKQCLRLKIELDNTRSICEDFHDVPKGKLHVVALDFFAKKLIYPRLNNLCKNILN